MFSYLSNRQPTRTGSTRAAPVDVVTPRLEKLISAYFKQTALGHHVEAISLVEPHVRSIVASQLPLKVKRNFLFNLMQHYQLLQQEAQSIKIADLLEKLPASPSLDAMMTMYYHTKRAFVCAKTGDMDGAQRILGEQIAACERAPAMREQSALLWQTKYILFDRQNDSAAAAKVTLDWMQWLIVRQRDERWWWESAVECRTMHGSLHFKNLEKRGAIDCAVAFYRQAVAYGDLCTSEVPRNLKFARGELAVALCFAGKFDEASQEFRKIFPMRGGEPVTKYDDAMKVAMHGMSLIADGDHEAGSRRILQAKALELAATPKVPAWDSREQSQGCVCLGIA